MDQVVQSQSATVALPTKPEGAATSAAVKRYEALRAACEKHVFDALKTPAPKPESMEERVTIAQMIAHYRSIGSVTEEQAQALMAASHKGRYELALTDRTRITITHRTDVADEKSKTPGQWGQRKFQRLKATYNGKEYRIYHSGFAEGSAGAEKFGGLTFQEIKNECEVDAQLFETLIKDNDGKYKLITTLRVFGLLNGDGIVWTELKPVAAGTNNSLSFEIE